LGIPFAAIKTFRHESGVTVWLRFEEALEDRLKARQANNLQVLNGL
jgi:hypothetical protein